VITERGSLDMDGREGNERPEHSPLPTAAAWTMSSAHVIASVFQTFGFRLHHSLAIFTGLVTHMHTDHQNPANIYSPFIRHISIE